MNYNNQNNISDSFRNNNYKIKKIPTPKIESNNPYKLIYNNNDIENDINNLNSSPYNSLLSIENDNISKIKYILNKTNNELKNKVKNYENTSQLNNKIIEENLILLDKLKNELELAEQKNKEYHSKYKSIKEKSEEIFELNNKYNIEYENDKKEYLELLKENNQLKNNYENILNKYKNEFMYKQQKNENLNKIVKEKENEIEEINLKNEELKNNLESLENIIEGLKKTIEILTLKEHEDFRAKNMEELNKILLLKNEEINKKNEEISNLLEINRELQKRQEYKISEILYNKEN